MMFMFLGGITLCNFGPGWVFEVHLHSRDLTSRSYDFEGLPKTKFVTCNAFDFRSFS